MVNRTHFSIPCPICGEQRHHSSKRSIKDRTKPCRSCGAKERWATKERKTREDRLAAGRAYNNKHKARLTLHYAKARDALRSEMVRAYGGACTFCNENDPIVLVLDHINDDGAEDRRNGHWGEPAFRRLKKAGWPRDRLQLLCHNCNARKEFKRRRAQLIAKAGGDHS